MTAAPETIWLFEDEQSGYHAPACQCAGHCRHCLEDLDEVRTLRARMIHERRMPASWQLGPRERYCSPYCRGRAKRERAFDRFMSRNAVSQA